MSAVTAAEAALARGDLLAAHDIAATAIERGEGGERLRFLQVLSLARMGDTATALALYEDYRLDAGDEVDTLALKGRLLKDKARAAPPGERAAVFAASSAAYAGAIRGAGDTFPTINAAATALLAGDRITAARLATDVLAAPADATRYFAGATRAEAMLIRGRVGEAPAALAGAARCDDADEGARSSTLRQIELLAPALDLDAGALAGLLAPLRPAPTLVFSGHLFRADPSAEAIVSGRIEGLLDAHRIRVGYGALGCGADILFAEAILRRGGELNVVLPFDRDTFARVSVLPGGAAWLPRYEACLAAAHSVDQASHAAFVGDDHQFTYGSMMAMGLALGRAGHLGGAARQIVLWDGAPAAGVAGTAIDVDLWRAHGGVTEVIAPPAIDRALDRPPVAARLPHDRAFRAILFADFVGFSRLSEEALPDFWRDVMGRAGAVLAPHPAIVNSWGDAVFAVLDDAVTAAEVALELRAAVGANMRIGVHFGPVFLADDPVTGRPNAFGSEVTRAARVEPIVPVGEVYATQQFAAMIALAAPGRYATHYCGRIALHKGYGTFKMFRLERTTRQAGATASPSVPAPA